MKPRSLCMVLSCEHGGNRVPREYRRLFRGKKRLLESHRGWDPGAREVARRLSAELGAPMVAGRVTRLLVDLNRRRDSPELWSKWTSALDEKERARIVRAYYAPYRDAVRSLVVGELRRGTNVLHVSVHSFTPVLRGKVRKADVGLLFDPRRAGERRICSAVAAGIRRADPRLVVRSNYPYLGIDDALTTALREELDPRRYFGIEIEMNQRLSRRPAGVVRLARVLSAAIAPLIAA